MAASRSISLAVMAALCLPLACWASPTKVVWDNLPYRSASYNDRSWKLGSATFYGITPFSQGTGNCGFPSSFMQTVNEVAVPQPRWSDVRTNGVANFPGAACGQCYELLCAPFPRYAGVVLCKNFKVLKVVITNYDVTRNPQGTGYPGPYGWPHNHFDLRADGFAAVAEPKAGVIKAFWRRVPCSSKLQPKYTVQGNLYWHDIVIFGVPGSGNIIEVWVQAPGSSSWVQAQHAWGAHFWLSQQLDFNNPAVKVKGRVAESASTWVYPQRVTY